MPSSAQSSRPPAVAPPAYRERVVGPYDVHVLAGGPGLEKAIPAGSEMLSADGTYTLSLWVRAGDGAAATTLLAGVGDDAAPESARLLGLSSGRPFVRYGAQDLLIAPNAIPVTGWHMLAVVSDGVTVRLFADGVQVAQGHLASNAVSGHLSLAPTTLVPELALKHFGGDLAQVSLAPDALEAKAIRTMAEHVPDAGMLRWEEASQPWPVQTRGQAGYLMPQDPSLMPTSKAPYGRPMAKPLPPADAPVLLPLGTDAWALRSHWRLAAAPTVSGDPAAISTAGFADGSWMVATVPGTVLTTMIDRGIYPDSDYGLNNLAIPEALNKQDYWYRIEFPTPAEAAGHRTRLTLNGINYAAEVWLNGKLLGDVRGAFIRGQFDATPYLRSSGKNALAVRISPPPHPGIPQEQSILGGPGENGGAMCLDGPTFVATEGWDWIPAIRDRNSGLWQDAVLSITDNVEIGDPRVVTHLPLPDTTTAEVSIEVPMRNTSDNPVEATVHAAFEGVSVDKTATLPPGESVVRLAPAEFPQLHLDHPRLWWPNGYGRPELYRLKLTARAGAAESDRKELTFGVREVTYELSLFDHTGHLVRDEVSPTVAKAAGEQAVDVHHEAMRRTAEFYVPSLTAQGEHSAAVKPVTNEAGFTDLVIKVNGVRIAARGGNWGMDDSRKRVSREHLEPYFRLHREANVNIIRNWVGQNTEEVFYQLADEYGMMVWNDFWASTQDYNVEPQDVPLFLANARDVVKRFRNHPSIILWCGRNEGVPQPILNEGLIDLLQAEDGTRYYTPGSNRIDLRNSGPYLYQDPAKYYDINKGFSVELGIPSLSTLESFQASIAPADQWPISDAWAYHDWHQSSNGDTHPFVAHLDEEFGAASDLKDFERKAQMLSYVDHRAIFEGFNEHLFQPNSGRMLWMTQPAWPSNMWQILSSDYDTQASFYAVKKACEPLHVQLDLTNYMVTAVNTTKDGAAGLKVRATVYAVAGQTLFTQEKALELQANTSQELFPLGLPALFAQQGAVLVELQMTGGDGSVVSRNVYWLAGEETGYRKLNTLTPAKLTLKAVSHQSSEERVVEVDITNAGTTPSLANKLTLQDAGTHTRILPAYYSDNYVSLLPGETVHLTIHYPAESSKHEQTELGLRGWNVPESIIKISASH